MQSLVAKKKFGQNFLINLDILNKISKFISATSDDLIIEIGPGTGNLTKVLKKTGANIICFEIDQTLKPFLDNIEDANTIIYYNDFLKINLKDFVDFKKYKNIFVVANIPYYITTPIIKKLINSSIKFSSIMLMVQKELAERLCALPKSSNYSSLSVYVNYFFEVKSLISVNKDCFNPIPKVDSMIIKMVPINRNKENFDIFEKLLIESFKFRRKTLKNNLKNYNLDLINQYLLTKNKSIANRPQDISTDEYVEIASLLSKGD